MDEELYKEWLCQDEFNWLQFDQSDLVDVCYYCILTNPQKVNAARGTIGIKFSVTCNSGHAWSNLRTKSYTCNGTLNFNFYNDVKYKKYELRPTMIITPLSNGNISIINQTTNQTVTINNCITTEVITLDNDNGMVDTTGSRVLLDDWNKHFISFKTGLNSISLSGNFTIRLEYRIPIRVGG